MAELEVELPELGERWEVGGAWHGRLPGPLEADLYVALHALWNERGRPADGALRVPTRELLARMNKGRGGAQYRALADALARLRAVVIVGHLRTETGKERTRIMGLLDHADVTKDGVAVVRLSKELCEAMSTNGRALDASRYFRLERPVSRRLYRYLDRRRYRGAVPQPELVVPLAELVAELPIQRPHPSLQKRTLAPAHAELVAEGFLREVTYQQQGRSWLVRYAFGSSSGAGASAVQVQGRTVADRVEELLRTFRDPQSVAFYAEVVKTIPEAVLDHMVGSVREQLRDGLSIDLARKLFTASARARMRA